MEYIVEGRKFSLSYNALREQHQEFCQYSDEEFLLRLTDAAHLACIIGWFKELPADLTIGDKGIVHELIHLMKDPNEPLIPLDEVRTKFATFLKLD